MSVASTWPPATLTVKTVDLIDECELMEIYPERGAGKALLPVRCSALSIWFLLWVASSYHKTRLVSWVQELTLAIFPMD